VIFTTTIIVRSRSSASRINSVAWVGKNMSERCVGSDLVGASGSIDAMESVTSIVRANVVSGGFSKISWLGQIARK